MKSKAIGLEELLDFFMSFEVRLGILSMNKPQNDHRMNVLLCFCSLKYVLAIIFGF